MCVIKFKQGKDLTLKSKVATLNVSVTCIYTRPFVMGEFLILKVRAEITIFVKLRLSLVSNQYMDHNNMV